MSNGISKTGLNLIPAGYKQTEVGVIPEDWKCYSFGDLVDYKKGYAFKSDEYGKTGIRIIRVSDTSYSSIKDDSPIFISDKLAKLYHAWSIKEGDLIFSTVGSKPPMYDSLVGKAIYVTKKHEGSLLNQNAVRIRAKSKTEGIQSLLLNHFRTERYIDFIELIFRGNANQASITLKNLFEFKIPLPRLKNEQTAIANALSDVDALIRELEKLIAKKQAIKTATMQQLLTGRTRLPQFALREDGSKKGTKQSELGEIPEDWEVKSFHQLATVKSGGTPSTHNKDFWDGKINWCTPTDITALVGRKYLSTTTRKITEVGVAKSAAELLPIGTVVMTSRATIGECAITTSEITTNQGFKNFICGSELDNEFLYYLLSNVKERLICLCSGSTFLEISTTQVKNFSVITTEKKEQTAIATILSDMDKEIQALEQRLSKTRQIKQGMMQELLTGKTRLVQGENA